MLICCPCPLTSLFLPLSAKLLCTAYSIRWWVRRSYMLAGVYHHPTIAPHHRRKILLLTVTANSCVARISSLGDQSNSDTGHVYTVLHWRATFGSVRVLPYSLCFCAVINPRSPLLVSAASLSCTAILGRAGPSETASGRPRTVRHAARLGLLVLQRPQTHCYC